MKKVAFYTLGCKLNFAETSSVSRSFEAKGYRKVEFGQPTDVYVINTCSVTGQADKKCRKVVAEGLKISPEARVIVIGCYAQLKPGEITEIPGVDLVLGAHAKFDAVEHLENLGPKEKGRVVAEPIDTLHTFRSAYSIGDRTRTFLKVQDGCDYPCTYCTIPLARGASRSDTIGNLVAQAREAGESGVREIVLTGVNTGDFGLQNGVRRETFLDLIRALDKVDNISRFRISSIEPNLLRDDIIDFVASSLRFVPHFHIPLQSGSNAILGLMKRRYRRELYAGRVERIRRTMPDACIGVDVIVGFPGETEEHFLETYHFLNELDISYLHVFPYSERANTAALELPGKAGPEAKATRSKMLHILSEKKRRSFYQSQIGRMEEVLFETSSKAGKMEGFTRNYVRVQAPYDPLYIHAEMKGFLGGFLPGGDLSFGEWPDPELKASPAADETTVLQTARLV